MFKWIKNNWPFCMRSSYEWAMKSWLLCSTRLDKERKECFDLYQRLQQAEDHLMSMDKSYTNYRNKHPDTGE